MGEGFLGFDIKTLIFIVIIIIVLISFVSILTLNIISYILFTIYCINDNINDYTSEEPTKITLEDKYKYRLLNYVINFNDNAKNNQYNLSTNYDNNSSDLYVHATIVYYNYIVKLLLLILIIILVAFLFNLFNIAIAGINARFCGTEMGNTTFIFSDIYNNDPYIYQIIIIIIIYIYLHSLIYTFGFNKNIYKDLYDLYEGEDGKYKRADMAVYLIIDTINNKDTDKTNSLSKFLSDFKDFSFDKLHFKNFLNKDFGVADNAKKVLTDLNSDGILNNNKFIIPTALEKETNINNILRRIYLVDTATGFYNTPTDTSNQSQEMLGDKIFIYLIYHYVISHNREDPLIIHKINNIFLNLFDNIHKKYNKDYASYLNKPKEPPDATPPPVDINIDDILNKFTGVNLDIKKMYNEIKSCYTIKQLLPATIKKEDILEKLHENADLILKYIDIYKTKYTPTSLSVNFKNYEAGRKTGFQDAEKATDNLYFLKKKIYNNINTFADSFSDYIQEDKTPLKVNTIVYKINLYLAVEMILTAVFILMVLLLLYSSNKYPDLEKYINIMITYAIIIINEVISAILGII